MSFFVNINRRQENYYDAYTSYDSWSPQSYSSNDSGYSCVMDQNRPPLGTSGDFYVAENIPNNFNFDGIQNLNYHQLHQATVPITYPPAVSTNQCIPHLTYNQLSGPSTSQTSANCYLEIIEEPSAKPFRFRYESERNGTHGSLVGINSNKSRKTFPTVALRNFSFPGKAYISCSLYQASVDVKSKRSPHPHNLVITKNGEEKLDPHVIELSNQNDFTATFKGMGIIHTAKRDIKQELQRKMRQELHFEGKWSLTPDEMSKIERDVEKQYKEMNLNQVCLCFQAFVKNEADNTMRRLCEPIFSNNINNTKSSKTGKLKIARMSKNTGSVLGDDEVFIFVEKVCRKNIKVKFFEFYDNGQKYWETFAEFNESDVHRQFGIVFRTPPYRKTDLEKPVEVQVQLFRPSDGAVSKPKPFTYKPTVEPRTKRSRNDSTERYSPTVSDSHRSWAPRPPRDDKPSQSCSSENSLGASLSGNHQQDFNCDDSLYEAFSGFFKTITASELNFSIDDLEGLPSSPEELCSLLDIEISGDSMLRCDSVCSNKPQYKKTLELRCPLFDKLRVLIRLFRSNFNHEKLRGMMRTLVDQQAETGENILLDLIQRGSQREIKELLVILIKYKLDAVLHSLNDLDQNCLHMLVLAGHHKLLKIFLSLGVDANQIDAFGYSPLSLAAGRSDEKLVKELLDAVDDLELNRMNDKGQSPLHLAVSQNNLAIVKLLVERGADLYKRIPQTGNTALHLAVSKSDFSMPLIAYLIERDENLLHKENNAAINVLQVAVSSRQPKSFINYLSQFYDESYSTEDSSDGCASDSDDSQSESGAEDEFPSTLFDGECFKSLCRILNSAEKWKHVLIIAEEEHKVDLWQYHQSPAKTLLFYLESIGHSIDDLQEIFDILDEKEASSAIDEMLARQVLNR